MKLQKMKVCNFRCFGEEITVQMSDLTCLVGDNSSGKTALLDAIKKILGNNPKDRGLVRSDFHLGKSEKPEDIQSKKMSIELVFEFPEVTRSSEDMGAIPIFRRHFVVSDPKSYPYIRIRLEAEWERSSNPEGSIESRVVYVVCPEGEKYTEDKLINAKRKELDEIRLIYIPANRNVEKEIKLNSDSIFMRLFNLVKWNDDKIDEVEKASTSLNSIVTSEDQIKVINDSIMHNWGNFNSDYRFNKSQILFSNSEITEILKKVSIGFTPSVTERDFLVEEMGDGSKSLLYFSLISALLDAESELSKLKFNDEIKIPSHTIFIAEEPENNIAPHLLGQLIQSIMDVSTKHKCQAIISSHSVSIISRINPIDIRLLFNKKSTYSSDAYSLELSSDDVENFKYIKNTIMKTPSIYFSKLVILVEGESEKLFIPRLLKDSDVNIDEFYISVVSIDSRFVTNYWKFLSQYKIPYLTLLDLDSERVHGGYKTISYLIKELSKFRKDFEDFEFEDGTCLIKDNIIDKMKDWGENKDEDYLSWIEYLEKYNVFLSYPLDLDFMLLRAYENSYKNLLENNEGPRIKKIGKISEIEKMEEKPDEYVNRVEQDLEAVLKGDGGDGSSFSNSEKKIMIWYKYFFLGKGKPISHYRALSVIDKKTLIDHLPEMLNRLVDSIKESLV
ncbi:DNA replication and repair protein RecF [Candidatus Izimaplasma bacterium HR1]|jgi:predicted ATP-dependent endonuclease of OLD family|uniref:ATP-dependent nuclease n=1 Tax=Candidatus Izimoplasma sp. HR1 TaxID=1541959 RepID=UPI0004F5C8FB|nr:DNA replication and repair protein RecF [Candidatus Izimaplasma bacterium HR1]